MSAVPPKNDDSSAGEEDDSSADGEFKPASRTSVSSKVNFSKLDTLEKEQRFRNMVKLIKKLRRRAEVSEAKNKAYKATIVDFKKYLPGFTRIYRLKQ